MTRLLLLVAVLAGGCQSPLPDGVPINSGPAVEFLLENFGGADRARPLVLGVLPNCTAPSGGRGFTDPQSGDCVGGFTRPDYNDIYIVIRADLPYSYALPHELLGHMHHPNEGDHHSPAIWGAGGLVERASTALAAQVDLETMVPL